MNFINFVKCDFGKLVVNNVPVDILRPILYNWVNFPKELEFVELWKVMDILKDFFEIFVRLEELIFFDGSETLEQIEEEMIFKVAGNNLVDNFERNICLDGIN